MRLVLLVLISIALVSAETFYVSNSSVNAKQRSAMEYRFSQHIAPRGKMVFVNGDGFEAIKTFLDSDEDAALIVEGSAMFHNNFWERYDTIYPGGASLVVLSPMKNSPTFPGLQLLSCSDISNHSYWLTREHALQIINNCNPEEVRLELSGEYYIDPPLIINAAHSLDTSNYSAHEPKVDLLETPLEFSTDWFSPNIPNWVHYFSSLSVKQDLKVLEIGSWEGRSALWIAENLLKGNKSRLDCIDLFAAGTERNELRAAIYTTAQTSDMYRKFHSNLRKYISSGKVRSYVGMSSTILPRLITKGELYDLIYIDGSHEAWDIQLDANLAYLILKPGGYIAFDDYTISNWSNPKLGIDTFLDAYSSRIEILHKGWQVFIRKNL